MHSWKLEALQTLWDIIYNQKKSLQKEAIKMAMKTQDYSMEIINK